LFYKPKKTEQENEENEEWLNIANLLI
jgi:hypothetical protein